MSMLHLAFSFYRKMFFLLFAAHVDVVVENKQQHRNIFKKIKLLESCSLLCEHKSE